LTNFKEALIIGTRIATDSQESGASLRLQSIKSALEKCNFNVSVTPSNMANLSLNRHWDAIVVISYSSARILRQARKQSEFLWFDPTDSWRVSRISLIKSGDLKQIFVLMRDFFWVWSSPKIDLLTFITKRDALAEKSWWINRTAPLIFPISDLVRSVNVSNVTRYVFIGDGNYGPNKKAFRFLRKVLGYLKDDVIINVYGRNFHSNDLRFRIHGYKDNSEIYFDKDIHLAPITSGAGLKLKVAIPLINGLRVVTTPEGANGFKENRFLKIATTPKMFASVMENLVLENSSKGGKVEVISPFEDDDSERLLEILKTLGFD
jgi:hypothetical protein